MTSEPEPTVPASPRWYAFSALAHQEATAEANLKRQGYSIFVPRLIVTRRRGGRFETKRAWH